MPGSPPSRSMWLASNRRRNKLSKMSTIHQYITGVMLDRQHGLEVDCKRIGQDVTTHDEYQLCCQSIALLTAMSGQVSEEELLEE